MDALSTTYIAPDFSAEYIKQHNEICDLSWKLYLLKLDMRRLEIILRVTTPNSRTHKIAVDAIKEAGE